MATKAPVLVTTPLCSHCNKVSEVLVSARQAELLALPRNTRPSMQDIFPDYSPDFREQFISGTHPECWNKMFGDF